LIKIAPSILSADFSRLGEEIRDVEKAGADLIHVDVMDGHFVPNLTVGPFIVEAARKVTSLPLDVHLMIEYPERYIQEFARAGSDYIVVHVETCPHLHRTVQMIKELGKKAGVTLNPATPLSHVEVVLPDIDLLLVMSVNPGFSGQKFIPKVLDKVRQARKMIDQAGVPVELEVDGGVKVENARDLIEAGADILVSGSTIFESKDSHETIARLKG
jgi:ribulose-phosphate 3-epimerase